MTTRTLLQLLAEPSGVPGELGFTLTGIAREGQGLCRVLLRRLDPWHRNLNPRIRSSEWDVRVYAKLDSAFSLLPDLTVSDLARLEEDYVFPDGGEALAGLALNGDPVHDRAVVWARHVTGAPELPAPPAVSPVMIPVRYKAAEALSVRGAAIPLGRSTPPMRPILPLSKDALRPQYLGGGSPSAAPARPVPARTAAAPAAAAVPAAPQAPAPPRPAMPPAAGGASPVAPPSRAALTERLQTLRSKAADSTGEESDS